MTSGISRRRFLKYSATAAGLGLTGCKGGSHPAPEAVSSPANKPSGPRYVVQLLLSGGHDPVYTTDPKERAEVEPDIDLPAENEITSAGNLRLGSHFGLLDSHASRLAILNGVQVGTANHDTGIKQFSRLKTRATDVMPSALDIIGTARDSQALGVVQLGAFMRTTHSPKFFGTSDPFYYGPDDIFAIAERHKEDGPALAAQLRKEAQGLGGKSLSRPQAVTLDNLLQSAAFFERLPDLPEFTPTTKHTDYTAQSIADAFDRTLWLLQNDLTRCVYVDLGLLGWDTHIRNAPRQAQMNRAFASSFEQFLRRLSGLSNEHGVLEGNTLIVAGSDMGRFPRLNAMEGKDHLPQTSFFFAGHGIAGGATHGQTDKIMKALPMSIKTGKAEDGGHIPLVDDIGTTVLRLCGFDPYQYGYSGRTLECLLA